MSGFKMDPEQLAAGTVHGRRDHVRVAAYGEVEHDGVAYGTLVYEIADGEWDSAETHVETRLAIYSTDRKGFRSDTIIGSRYNDFKAYEARLRASRPPAPPEPVILADEDEVEGWTCGDCGEAFVEPGGPVYECGSCGDVQSGDDGNRCPSCHKFMAKSCDLSCPECSAGEDSLLRAVLKPTDQGGLGVWTLPGMDRAEYLDTL